MKLKPEIEKAIQEAAIDAGVPISLVRGMVCQESSGNPKATRYEPGFFTRYMLKIPGIGTQKRKDRATSWGLLQIMGQVAREHGYTGPFTDLLKPEVGLYWGLRHLKRMKSRHWLKYGWAGVLAAYNAGSPRLKPDGTTFKNQYYVDKVLEYSQGGSHPK